jgi:P-type Ca2+ transporter type 2C
MRTVSVYAVLIASASFLVLAWATWSGLPRGQAMTMNFMTLAFAQLTHLGNARDAAPVIRFKRAFANRMALIALGLSVVLQLATVADLPLRDVLRLEPLSAGAWVVVIAVGLIPGVVGQAAKVLRGRGNGVTPA